MKIKILDGCKTVNGKPVKIGDIVDTDANTARNLIKKNFAAAADDEAKKLDLEAGSQLTAHQAQVRIAQIVAARETARANQPRARA